MGHLRKFFYEPVDLSPGVHLGYGDQHMPVQRWIFLDQVKAAEDTMRKQVSIDFSNRPRAFDHKFMEERLR